MTVGNEFTREMLDARAGTYPQSLYDFCVGVIDLNTYLLNTNDAALKALPKQSSSLALTDAEILLLRNSYGDLNNLVLTALGSRTQPVATSFVSNARFLTGGNAYQFDKLI
jgi:hypothetical protein